MVVRDIARVFSGAAHEDQGVGAAVPAQHGAWPATPFAGQLLSSIGFFYMGTSARLATL